jgi:hypothetical protein
MNHSGQNDRLTKEDLDALRQELLAKLASKEEIAKLATKEEISKLATKEEHAKLRESFDRLAGKFVSLEIHVETKEDANKKYNSLMNAIDGLAKNFDDYRIEKIAADAEFRRQQKQIDDHEKRITRIEKKAG